MTKNPKTAETQAAVAMVQERAAPTARAVDTSRMSGIKKAAILCMALGNEFATRVMISLPENEQERLASEIARQQTVSREVSQAVVGEFNTMMQGAMWLAEGGMDYAKQLLIDSVGSSRAEEMLARIRKELDETGLARLRKADPEQLRTLLRGEHEQTIALILAHLDPRQSAAVLAGFEPDLASDVLFRIAAMDKVSPEMLEIIEKALGGHALDLSTRMSRAGGPASVAEVLNNTAPTFEKDLLERIAERSPELSQEIKNLMFVFEDIVKLTDVDMQKLIEKVDKKDLAYSLKTASEDIKGRLLGNMPKRMREQLEEEVGLLGPVKVKDVDAAQSRIVATIRSLEDQGIIQINYGGEGDELID
jgi:flagellar motor switch protein FliG